VLVSATLVTLHVLAVLTTAVFLAARSALLRPEVGERRAALLPVLRRLDRITWAALLALGLTGFLLVGYGPYGPAFYGRNLLLTLMALGWIALLVQAAFASRRLGRLARGESTAAPQAFDRLRSSLMAQGHLLALIVVVGVFLSLGYGLV
jgi:uncharacterized membrane protein